MPDSKKKYGLPIGRQGSLVTDPVTEIIKQSRADSERKKLERQDKIDELKSEAERQELEKKLTGEEKERMAELEQQNEELQKQLQEKEIDRVKIELGGKIDQLNQSIKEGASQKSIGEQIAEIKQAAADMGLGGSKFSEVQEALDLVDKLRPNKGLADQVKDARDLLDTFKKEESGGLSGDIQLELKKMEIVSNRELEKMRDERAARDRGWELKIKQWEEERADKQAQIQAEIATKKEGNQLLAAGIEKLGEVITAARGAGVGAVAAAGAGAIASKVIEASEGEAGEVQCPITGCGAVIPISESADDVVCAGCGAQYTIERMPKTTEEAPVVAGKKAKGK